MQSEGTYRCGHQTAKANIKKVGLIGGIQWNETTGNLIDGHKRVMSVDLIQGYDGTPETDYDIKVEAVDLTKDRERAIVVYGEVARPDRLQLGCQEL